MKLSKNFTSEELACKHCGKINFHPGFIDKLQLVRDALAMPMVITSGGRCREHNTRVGGHPMSLHILEIDELPYADRGQQGSLAVDIRVPNGIYRGDLFTILWRQGFSIGWNAKNNFLHADLRKVLNMPQTSFDY